MTELASIIDMDQCPTGMDVAKAVSADISTLAHKHVQTPDGDWPETREKIAAEHLAFEVARELMAATLDSEAMKVVDAVLSCARAETDSLYNADICPDTIQDDLTQAADSYGLYIHSVVSQHVSGDGLE